MCGGGGDGGAAASRQMEIDRQNRIKEGIAAVQNAFKGFDQGFYDKQRANYTAWAQPQINRQYDTQLDQLRYGIARTGLGGSSVAAKAKGDLSQQLSDANMNMAQAARDYMQRSQNQVEAARQDLIAQATATADPQLVANNAISRAQMNTAGPAFTPLGSLFNVASPIVANDLQMQMFKSGFNNSYQNANPYSSRRSGSGKVIG